MTMNRDRPRNGKPTSALHALVVAEPERGRPSWRALLLMSMAVVAGITAALLWLYQNPRGSLQTLPDALANATASAVASSVVSATDAATAPATALADVATALPGQAQEAVAAAGAAKGNVAPSSVKLAATLAPAAPVTLAPPTPTSTWTPEPPLADLEAVVAI